jgi:hypothetical protein
MAIAGKVLLVACAAVFPSLDIVFWMSGNYLWAGILLIPAILDVIGIFVLWNEGVFNA